MTTKTPEQIADEVVNENSIVLSDTSDHYIPMLIAAIEADRAQRAADLQILADAASAWATALTDDLIPYARHAHIARKLAAEREAIQAALDRYLDQTEEEN